MAFQCFADEQVDFQVIEVGLGGRLDATNVVEPDVCAITNISLDHMAILGDTVEEIASEKAGIIKPGVPVVVAPQSSGALEVIRSAAREKEAPVVLVGRDVTWKFQGLARGNAGAQVCGNNRPAWRIPTHNSTAGPPPVGERRDGGRRDRGPGRDGIRDNQAGHVEGLDEGAVALPTGSPGP